MTPIRDWLSFEASLFSHDPREWVVLTGDRRLVSAIQFAIVLAIFAGMVHSGYVPLIHETAVLFLLFALIAANFTLIAIVTSLSQIVIGQRLETPGEIRSKIDEAIAYREAVGTTIDRQIMPVRPDAFFLGLFEHAEAEIELIRGRTAAGRTRRTREELVSLSDGLESHVQHVTELLTHPSSELKHALFAALNTNYENHVHRAWHLEMEYTDEYTEAVGDPLTRLTDTLEHIVVASRLFNSTFIESELSELSRYLLYVGLPVQVVAMLGMLVYSAPDAVPVIPHGTLQLILPIVLAAGFAPFLILSAYIVRLTIVARRTADTFPFSSQLQTPLDLNEREYDH